MLNPFHNLSYLKTKVPLEAKYLLLPLKPCSVCFLGKLYSLENYNRLSSFIKHSKLGNENKNSYLMPYAFHLIFQNYLRNFMSKM